MPPVLRKLLCKLLLAGALAVALAPASPLSLSAQAELPPADAGLVRTEIDLILVEHLAKLAAYQDGYLAAAGRYYQHLDSHSAPPADGARLAPDKEASKPTDQPETLDTFLQSAKLTLGELPYSFRTDVYDGPRGRGYVLTVTAELEKGLWLRSVNVGPETFRERGWEQVVVEEGQR